jgi:Flp pilus assembly protein TadD
VYFQRGDYRKALEHLERAVELAGEDPTVIEHLGDVYDRLGQHREALRVYRDALGYAEDAAQVERLRGKMAVLEGRLTSDDPRL